MKQVFGKGYYNKTMRMDQIPRYRIALALVLLFVITAPYLYAYRSTVPDWEFLGFLVNPIDGNTYLAKMYQGWSGSWRILLPYTAEPGEGAFLFLIYILLGHAARLFNLPLLLVFHLARLLSVVGLVISLNYFFKAVLPSQLAHRIAITWVIFGSGLGWLVAITTGAFAMDFWVAEAYPFLSAFVNPHFPLSLAILLALITPREWGQHEWIYFLLGGGVLAVLSPFALVVLVILLGIDTILAGRESGFGLKRLFFILVGGVPYLMYDLWVVATDPVFKGWNAQNLTPAPTVTDLLASLSPAILIVGLGLVLHFQKKIKIHRLLLIWVVMVLPLVYLPFNLQRRFLVGIYVPVVGMAASVLYHIMENRQKVFQLVGILLLILSLPTNLLILVSTWQGIQARETIYFLSIDESQALAWIQNETPQDALILASPETGLIIPAKTGRRVIYGHPFETVNADIEKQSVLSFFQGDWPTDQSMAFLHARGVDYVFIGAREREISTGLKFPDTQIVYENDSVTIFQLP